ncbi:MAG: tetratricopeptide repeat protein [candidate division Zixibacteria bacterium]|nr:tetratricopeptide repeat protein [candidate division Zixibacteria bacterium]
MSRAVVGLSGLGLVIAALVFTGCGAKTMQYSGSLDTPEAEYAKALSLLQSGAHDEAEAALRRTMRLDEGYAPAYVGMSRLLLERGDVKEAIRYVHMARIRDVDYVPCWLMAARLYDAAGQYEAAVAEFREAITRDKDRLWAVESYFDLARTLEKLDRLEEAHDAYMEVITLDPLHLEARSSVTRIWKTLGPEFLMRLRYENRDIILP